MADRPWSPDASLSLAPVACYKTDLEGRLVWVNNAACCLLDVGEADLLGRQVWEFVAPEEQEDVRRAVVLEPGAEGMVGRFERTFVRSDGTRLLLESREQHVRDETGSTIGLRTFLINVTERKRVEQALRTIRENLEVQSREQNPQNMGALAGAVAHEFSNLLTSVMDYANLAAIDLADGFPVRENIGHTLEAASNPAGLPQQMLVYSGAGESVLELLDISKLVEGMVCLLESLIGKAATLELSLCPDLPPIEGDAVQVRQVVLNLFTNAMDAVEEPGGHIAVSTGIIWAEGGELPPLQTGRILCPGLYVYIEVRDTGSGMDAGTLAQVFDPFFTTRATGRGLGLAAARGIMRGHHGSIQVASQLGEGSLFRVLFPAKEE